MVWRRPGTQPVTLGADKNYATQELVRDLRQLAVRPHLAQNNKNRSRAIDNRTTRHAGYLLSQRKRKRVEECFGWMKTVALLRKLRHRGHERLGWMFTWVAATYNLMRIRNLIGAPA
jgi:Transposase DDE domain